MRAVVYIIIYISPDIDPDIDSYAHDYFMELYNGIIIWRTDTIWHHIIILLYVAIKLTPQGGCNKRMMFYIILLLLKRWGLYILF